MTSFLSITRFAARFGAASGLALAGAATAQACSICGCAINLDWVTQGFSTEPGFAIAFRYDTFTQNRLYHGSSRVDRAALDFPNDQEIQQETRNRQVGLDLDYRSGAWSIRAQLPWVDRYHTTIGEGDTVISTSQARGIGDVKVTARWIPDRDNPVGLQFGLKLPTGAFRQNFSAGPLAGQPLDRGLQLGTGTTDLLAGISWYSSAPGDLGAFASAEMDWPLSARAGFMPSTSLNLGGGLRWNGLDTVKPELQLSLRWEGRESGVEADHDNSGGLRAYASPGLTVRLAARTHAYAFVQIPVYRRVNGLQLDPGWMLSFGCRTSL